MICAKRKQKLKQGQKIEKLQALSGGMAREPLQRAAGKQRLNEALERAFGTPAESVLQAERTEIPSPRSRNIVIMFEKRPEGWCGWSKVNEAKIVWRMFGKVGRD